MRQRAVRTVVLLTKSNAHKVKEKDYLLDQEWHIIRRIRPRSSWLPQRPRPIPIWPRHIRRHRMKPVASKWIRHIAPLPARHCDFHLVETDDLRRRNAIFRPVPVCEPQLESSIHPLCFVGSCVRRSDLLCMLIDDLLQKKKKEIENKTVITCWCYRRLKRDPPRRAWCTAYAKSGTT